MANPNYVFTGGSAPEDFEPNSVEEVGGMLGKIALQVIRNVTAVNPLNVFSKMMPENGDTIEQVVVKMASARAYDKTGANALSRKTPGIVSKLFNDFTRATYDTTVDIPEIRKVLIKSKPASELSSKIVAALSEGETDETYQKLKELFAWGRQDGDGKVLKLYDTIAYGNTGIDYTKTLISLKDTVKGMQFVNSKFNTSELKRRTMPEDIYILMPYELKNRIDVDELAGVFNLDKAELKNRIIEIDTETETIGDKSSYVIYVVDKNAVLNYIRLYEMADQKNADGLFWNYFLHTDKMYGLSPLFDCGYIVVNVE